MRPCTSSSAGRRSSRVTSRRRSLRTSVSSRSRPTTRTRRSSASSSASCARRAARRSSSTYGRRWVSYAAADRPPTAMNFDINTEELGNDAYVISLAGEVDLYTAPEFKEQLLEVVGKGGKEVVVDLSRTTFIDSTTLGVLVGGIKRLRPTGGQLTLGCSDRNITKIFEITGLDKVFPIYASRAEAVENIDANGGVQG